MNVMMLLEMAAGAFDDRVALTCGGQSVAYAELFAAAGSAAVEIRAAAAAQVALLDTSGPAVPVALFGAACAGVPFVPLNYRLAPSELDALAARISPALLVTDAEHSETIRKNGQPGFVEIHESASFSSRHLGASEQPDVWDMDPDGVAILLFTSGTTGVPKAAVLRHRHLTSYILGAVEFASAGLDEAALVSVPPYHIAGRAALRSNLYAGRRIVQLPQFEPGEWIRLVAAERVTHAFVVPTMLARIVEALDAGTDARSLASLTALAYGGGKMPLNVIERAMDLLPDTNFTNAYGLTETSSTISVLDPDAHRAAAANADPVVRRRLTSVGQPLPTVEVEIRDAMGQAVPPETRGEIFVRADQVSGEYLDQGSLLVADGWFPTRDGGYLDEDGYLYLDGRVDDVIVRGGENLSPGEIEDVLLGHDAVADCAVVGVPDEDWGEVVAAAVVLHTGRRAEVEDLQALVRSQLRSNRMPAVIAFREELPYNETGKLLRRIVRAELSADSGASDAAQRPEETP